MSEHFRRIIIAIAIFAAATLTYQRFRSGHGGYGLFDLVTGRKESGAAEKFTPPVSGKLLDKDVPGLAQLSEESAKLSAAVLPSVVSVNTKTVRRVVVADDFFGFLSHYAYNVEPGVGSGVIVSKEGHVVTNFHVVKGAAQTKITTNDHKEYDAELIGADERMDIAVLRIVGGGGNFPALAFANSSDVRSGQLVFAVGNPFGLSATVTQGIISATQRRLSDTGNDYLQTDCVINPGNSGGPLVNHRGEIVGINVSIFSGDEKLHTWQGIGLAIPANDASAAFQTIMGKGAPVIGYIGIAAEMVTYTLGGERGLGVLVTGVAAGSPAQKAGLLKGDLIVKYEGKTIGRDMDIIQLIRDTTPGATVSMTVLRNKQPVEITAHVESRPARL